MQIEYGRSDIHELTDHRILFRDVDGEVEITLEADSALVIVIVPAGCTKTLEKGILKENV